MLRPLIPLACRVLGTGALFALTVSCESPNPSIQQSDAGTVDSGSETPDAGPVCAVGQPCDDGDPCTERDRCTGGVCRGAMKDCDDLDLCTRDACNLSDGACEHRPIAHPDVEGNPDEPACDDGRDADCDGLVDRDDPDCRLCAIAADCPDPGPCRVVACETGQCRARDVEDGVECDDELRCTSDDTCRAGLCAGSALPCDAPLGECEAARCSPATGECEVVAAEDDSACSDADPCTSDDGCQGGLCGGAPLDCSALGGPCLVGLCDAAAGGCVAVARPDDTPCGGLDACIGVGVCTGGLCSGATTDCSFLDGPCRFGVCDPALGGCAVAPVRGGTVCNDHDACTTEDVCGLRGCQGRVTDCSDLDDACSIGQCDAESGECATARQPQGAPCDDGSACTREDACEFGVCAGRALICAADPNTCQVAQCSPEDGQCEVVRLPAGEACDDLDPCTQVDGCADGRCQGAAVSCDDGDACTADACDAETGLCLRTPVRLGVNEINCADGLDDDCDGRVDLQDADCRDCVADRDCEDDDVCTSYVCTLGRCVEGGGPTDGLACNDADACTENDVCDRGHCGGARLDCAPLNGVCSVGRCEAATGLCQLIGRPNGIACDDSDPCTQGETCTDATCAGPARDCTDLDDACHVGACRPDSGECVREDRGEGTRCDDGSPCSSADRCEGGFCVGEVVVCDPAPADCEAVACDPQSGACRAEPVAFGERCDDGDPCTTIDACTEGACVGAPIDCSALDGPCVVGVCDGVDGGCRAVPRPDQLPCTDGDLCTSLDACIGGACLGTVADCSALDGECLVGYCDSDSGRCVVKPSERQACDDGAACTVNDACVAGDCTGQPVNCSALDTTCAQGVCEVESGRCVTAAVREDEGCDDGQACTQNERCRAGLCVGPGLDCRALDRPCASGQCDAAAGACVSLPVAPGSPCDDLDLCSEASGCARDGTCQGTPRDCSAVADACHTSSCDPRTGACIATVIDDGTPCEDADPCSVDETCRAGVCGGPPKSCAALDSPCTQGFCDAAAGGVCVALPVLDGLACETGDLCQLDEACVGGVCQGRRLDCPAPVGDPCRVGICDARTGACGQAVVVEGTPCEDGAYCTTGDTCRAGICSAGGARDCAPPGQPCRQGSCNEGTNRCDVQNRQNLSACDDGLYCTESSRCWDGACVASQNRSCPGANFGCQSGVCNEGLDRCDLVNAQDNRLCFDNSLCTYFERCRTGVCVPGGDLCD